MVVGRGRGGAKRRFARGQLMLARRRSRRRRLGAVRNRRIQVKVQTKLFHVLSENWGGGRERHNTTSYDLNHFFFLFLDESSHLYKRVCPSVVYNTCKVQRFVMKFSRRSFEGFLLNSFVFFYLVSYIKGGRIYCTSLQ